MKARITLSLKPSEVFKLCQEFDINTASSDNTFEVDWDNDAPALKKLRNKLNLLRNQLGARL